jgi:rhodanese-related sulfurtransferase
MKRLYVLVLCILFILCGIATVKADITPVPGHEYQDITPEQAYEMVEDPTDFGYPAGTLYILDVRTPAEWNWVGHPGVEKCYETKCGTGDPVSERGNFLEGKVINIPWKVWVFDPETKQYVEELNKFFDEEVVRQFSPDDTIIIMCRSGSRSVSSSEELEDPTHPAYKRLEELGFYSIYNMLGGFEGGTDKCCYRKKEAGWKNIGLPYNYSTKGIWIPQQKGRSLGN